jgi:hypothetical protein
MELIWLGGTGDDRIECRGHAERVARSSAVTFRENSYARVTL